MVVKFCVDSCANVHSCREQLIDIEKVYGITDKEWINMSDDDKYDLVNSWADERLEIYWEEV